jgi:plastocyanin
MKTVVKAAFLGMALIGLAACGGDGDSGGDSKPADAGGDAKPADSGGDSGGDAAQAYDASKFKGSITGSVKFSGQAKPRLLPVGGDAVCVGAWGGKEAVNQDYQVNADSTIPYAIVYVKSDVLKGFTFTPPTDRNLVIDQKDCYYEPHVFWVMAGESFKVTNSDKTQHNVHAVPGRNDEINKAQNAGAADTFVFKKKESKIVPFSCDVHSWMSAHCMVSDHPFVATTDDKGNFEITGLPPGDYTVKVWTKQLGKADAKVTIADAAVTQDFTTK